MKLPYIIDIHVHASLKPPRQRPVRNIWEYIDTTDDCEDFEILL